MRFDYFYSSTLIGLDIQPNEIRFLELRHLASRVSVAKAAIVDLPRNAIIEGKIQKMEVVSGCLRELMAKTSTTVGTAAVALPAHCVISKKVQLPPALRGIERSAEIAENVSRYFPKEELMYDYATLSVSEANVEEILLVAARSDQLNSYASVIESAGLKLKFIDVDVYALARAMVFNTDFSNSGQMMTFLDVGECITQLVVADYNEVVFHQQIQNTAPQEMVRQINYALQLYQTNERKVKMNNKMYLSGMMTDFTDTLSAELPFDTHYINPLTKIHNSEGWKFLSEKMLLCCGLALRGNCKW